MDIALTADRLNTALYQASPPSWADWRARLEALDGTVDIAVDRLSHDILRGQGFRLRAALDAGRLDLAELRLVDFAGAGLELTGTVDLPLGAWDVAGDLRLPEPKPILRLLRIEPPLEIDRLAPMRLHAESRREAGATSLDLRLDANGAEAALTGQLAGAVADGAFDLSVTARAQETSDLLVALGWPAPAERPAFGPLAVTAKASRGNGPIAITAEATAGDDELLAELALETGDPRPRLSGSVRAPRLDEGLVAALYETLALPLDFPPGSPWLWPGIWPATPLAWGWLDRLDLDLALEVAALRDLGRDQGLAGAEVALDDGVLAIQGLRLPVAGGTLTGTATLEGKGDHAVLGADLRLADARAEELAAAAAPGSTIRGELDLDAALLGQGRSIADLVSSLSGTGTLTLEDARLTGVELGDAAPAAQIEAATLSGPFAITAGALTSTAPGLALSYPGGSATVDLRLDLPAWILEAHLASRRDHPPLSRPTRPHPRAADAVEQRKNSGCAQSLRRLGLPAEPVGSTSMGMQGSPRMGGPEWALLLLLALLWGSSFLFAKIAVAEVPPLTLVFGRVGLAALALQAVILATGQRMPLDRRACGSPSSSWAPSTT